MPSTAESRQHAVLIWATDPIIITINPACEEILGEKCYPDMEAVPFMIDIVNVFRRRRDHLRSKRLHLPPADTAVWV